MSYTKQKRERIHEKNDFYVDSSRFGIVVVPYPDLFRLRAGEYESSRFGERHHGGNDDYRYDSLLRSSTQKASSTSKFKNNGELIATVTLTATFGYDGSRAWVVSASGSHSMESGWTYSNQSISKSGGTANLTADIKSTTGLGSFPVDISLTCSTDGDIS